MLIAINQGLDAINKIRAEHNLPAYLQNAKVDLAAEKHVVWMCEHNRLVHTAIFGSNLGTRLHIVKFEWTSYAENIASGQSDVEAACKAWMSDAPHRKNMLGKYQYASVYSVLSEGGLNFWIADFASGE